MHLKIEPKDDHWEVTLTSMYSNTLEGAIKDMEYGMDILKTEFEVFKRDRKKDAVPPLCRQN